MNIPLSKPLFDDAELAGVKKVLVSGWVMQGPMVDSFEKMFAEYVGTKWAVAVSSCSTALFLALRACGISDGDEVIVPSLTWVATAAAVEQCGARPIFCDNRLDTFNIDPELVELLITQRTKAIVAVNLFGLAADLERLREIAAKNDLILIEDAACSLGATIRGTQSGTFGRLGCFSFHPRKSITTGEGGMIVGNSPDDEVCLRSLRSHGISIRSKARSNPPQPYDLGEFDNLGYNFRLTDIQAAVGVAQMQKLEAILSRRREIAAAYSSALRDLVHFTIPTEPKGCCHTYQSFVILVDNNDSDTRFSDEPLETRNRLMIGLKSAGIATRPGTHAVHSLSYFANKYSIPEWSIPNAMRAQRQSIALPLYPSLARTEIDYVIDVLKRLHDSIEMQESTSRQTEFPRSVENQGAAAT